jgi:16S rRNA (cytidine1402-2'-O)-methyltransferase
MGRPSWTVFSYIANLRPGRSSADQCWPRKPDKLSSVSITSQASPESVPTLDAEAIKPGVPGAIVYLVPTPVGNLGDITLRALEVLKSVDAIAAEDTRHSRQLLTHFGIDKPLVRLDAHTMRSRARGVLEKYPRLAYVSDAGSPGLSDPGAELVGFALDAGTRVEALPGPTALIPALTLSGLPVGRFTFHGFLPRSGRERRERLEEIAQSTITSALYESPHRLSDTLADLGQICGPNRPCAVARELSKRYEEVFRGTLQAAHQHFTDPRGEIVVIVGPSDPDTTPTISSDDLENVARTMAANGKTAREIRAELMKTGLERNRAYALALEATNQRPQQEGEET